ncbi:MAG: glycosyltransferase [Bacteroidia bacterium]|nr:glycosyltransferase [Bacteroidia bacterium]
MPLIHTLRRAGMEVVLAGSGDSLQLLRQTFPELPGHELPAYAVRYARGRAQVTAVVGQLPRLAGVIREEHARVAALVKQERIDIIISDNRYGVWVSGVPSVFIGHQLAPVLPGMYRPLRGGLIRLHQRMLRHFARIWVPDMAGNPLTGILTADFPADARLKWTGPMSRFEGESWYADHSAPEILAVISGPEPQRTLLEDKLLDEAHHTGRDMWIIQGKPGPYQDTLRDGVRMISHLSTSELGGLMLGAGLVISRSGYSSLMDYTALGLSRVALIPTPGQPEQEYLGYRLHAQGVAYCVDQDAFSLEKAISESVFYQGFSPLPVSYDWVRDMQSLVDSARRASRT